VHSVGVGQTRALLLHRLSEAEYILKDCDSLLEALPSRLLSYQFWSIARWVFSVQTTQPSGYAKQCPHFCLAPARFEPRKTLGAALDQIMGLVLGLGLCL